MLHVLEYEYHVQVHIKESKLHKSKSQDTKICIQKWDMSTGTRHECLDILHVVYYYYMRCCKLHKNVLEIEQDLEKI